MGKAKSQKLGLKISYPEELNIRIHRRGESSHFKMK